MMAMAMVGSTGAAVPQPGGEDTGSGEEGWRPEKLSPKGVLGVGLRAVGDEMEVEVDDVGGGGGREESEEDDYDSLEFQDARDPISEVCVTSNSGLCCRIELFEMQQCVLRYPCCVLVLYDRGI